MYLTFIYILLNTITQRVIALFERQGNHVLWFQVGTIHTGVWINIKDFEKII